MSRGLAHLSDEALVALVAHADEDALAGALRSLRPWPTASLCASFGTPRSPRTRCKKDSSRSGARPPLRRGAREGEHMDPHPDPPAAVDLVRREQPRRAEPLDAAPQESGDDTEEEAWLRLPNPRCRRRSSGCPTSSGRRSSSPTTAASRSPSSPTASASRWATIKSRMFSGLASLRELLAEEELEEEEWNEPRSTT